ncbi:MAG: homoserine kinase [Acinetobacter sp.]|jgi:homoserine kinase type II|nr:MAG: homoserine kinase [Acinetobacter sp.]
MSVYTPLNLEQVQTFAQPYGLHIVEIQPIQGGMENTNYFLIAADGKQYVLTVFEELDLHAASELFPVLQHLAQQQIPVAVPLVYADTPIHTLENKPAQIAPRLSGQHPMSPTTQQVQAMGTALAQLHLALQHFPLQRHNQHGQAWWDNTIHELKTEMTDADILFIEQMFQQLHQVQTQHPNRPKGLIHADLFRDNSLYVGDELSGILDFSELGHDAFLFDIAITMNDFCSDFPQVHLDMSKARAFLAAYHAIRPLTADERACCNIYLALAACRFWLARLQVAKRNRLEGRTGKDILQKDPNEMRLMMIDRLTQESFY